MALSHYLTYGDPVKELPSVQFLAIA